VNYNTGHRIRNALVSPSVDLSVGLTPITLLFTEDYFTEKGWDFCMVDVSSDGGSTWNHLRGGYGDAPSGDSYGWKVTTLDLSPYAGSMVQIRFMFDTGDSLLNDFPGWFVDNVVVYDQSGTISGTVFFDANQSGTKDSAEPWLDNWYVTANGPITITTRSRMFGVYDLPLPLGSYILSETVSAFWTQTSPPGSAWNIDLTSPGQTESDRDFGNYRPFSTIQGVAFEDADRDSAYDPAEPFLPGWEIDLYDSSGRWIANRYADAEGEFTFLLFEPGRYQIVETVEDFWESTLPGGDQPSYIVDMPTLGSVVGGLLFGAFHVPFTATIGGYLFNDVDHNGLQDLHESGVAGRIVEIFGPMHRVDVTTESGAYTFENLPSGTYLVRLRSHYAWMQTSPESTYSVTLSAGQSVDSLVFGTYKLLLGAIRGFLFNDLNRNGIREPGEPALEEWVVTTNGPEPWDITSGTDSTGRYMLEDLVAGTHEVKVRLKQRWGRSLPPLQYVITLADQEIKDSVDFGLFAMRTGSISGTVFNDVNANQIRDPGEPTLGGREVRLKGAAAGTVFSDSGGAYRFDSLWAGSYSVLMDVHSRWRQTFPPMLQPHVVALLDEEDRIATDFGLALDSSFSLAFRTFLPESLALAVDQKGKHNPVPVKPDKCIWRTGPIQPSPLFLSNGDSVKSLTFVFKNPMIPGSVASTHPVSGVEYIGTKTVRLTFSPYVQANEVFSVSGVSRGAKRQFIRSYQFTYRDSSGRVRPLGDYFSENRPAYPMPNAINVLASGAGSLIRVGPGGAHSVVHRNYKDIGKSLLEKFNRMHIGDPRCLGVYAHAVTRSMKKQLSSLPPGKGNNRLFAEGIAFKVNIKASELWITPPGFGDLIVVADSANQFNGMSLRRLGSKMDSAMASFDEATKTCRYPSSFFDSLFTLIRSIDSVFSGAIDTLSFGQALSLTPVRALADVPFLRLDSSAAFSGFASRPVLTETWIPEQFALDQNYPNPFNPVTVIGYSLPVTGFVTLKVYNMLGQEVATILDRELMENGAQEVEFDGSGLASGVYFYRLTADAVAVEASGRGSESYVSVRKMMLMR
jgi:hypothetical protein